LQKHLAYVCGIRRKDVAMMKLVFVLVLSLLSRWCFSQDPLNIDLNRIPQEKIRNLIEDQCKVLHVSSIREIEPTCRKKQSLTGYRLLESVYTVKQDPETVWKIYRATSPAESWNGRMVSFGLLVSKWKEGILYSNDSYFSGIDTGQVFYVNLKIMKGLYNLAVGLEIIEVDSANKAIKFSYLNGGKSRGEQMIYFVPTKKGHTRIIHRTAFQSNSYLRDRFLYPYFHQIAINEFHRNMKNFLVHDRSEEHYVAQTIPD
jgi:hypothetical protein